MVFTVIAPVANATAKYRTTTSVAAFAVPIATQGCQLLNGPPGANGIATMLTQLNTACIQHNWFRSEPGKSAEDYGRQYWGT